MSETDPEQLPLIEPSIISSANSKISIIFISPELSRSPNAHSIQALVGYAKNLCQPAGGFFSTHSEESALWM